MVSLKYYFIKIKLFITYAPPIYRAFLSQIIFTACAVIFYMTALVLFTNFIWNMINLKLFIITLNYKYYMNTILIMLITYLCRHNLYASLVFIIYLKSVFFILILSIKKFKGQTLIFIVHFLLVFSLIFSYFSCYSGVDMWSAFYLNLGSTNCHDYTLNSTKIDSEFNFFRSLTAYEGKSFDLKIYKSFLCQKYFPSSALEHYTTSLVDSYTPSLNSQILTLFILIICSLNRRTIF